MTLRHRQRGGYGASTATRVTNTSGNVQWTTTNPGNGEVSWMTDVLVPQYHQRSKAGEVIMNPLTSVTNSYASEGVGYQIRLRADGETEQGNGNMNFFVTGIDHGCPSFAVSQEDADDLIKELSTSVRGSRGSGNAGSWENLSEMKRTLEMIRHPVASFWKFDRRFSKASVAKSTANAWLQYRYGLSPIIRDVTTIVKNLQTIRPPRQTTRAKGSISSQSVSSRQVATGIITSTVSTVLTETYSGRVMSIDEANCNLSYDLGFTAKDLIRLPYDLISLSFVADWFVNTGNYINAVSDSLVGPKNLGACMTGIREISEVTTIGGSFLNSQTEAYTLTRPFAGTVIRKAIIKERIPGLLDPSLVVRSSFGFDRGVRVGDAVALIGQAVLSKFR